MPILLLRIVLLSSSCTLANAHALSYAPDALLPLGYSIANQYGTGGLRKHGGESHSHVPMSNLSLSLKTRPDMLTIPVECAERHL